MGVGVKHAVLNDHLEVGPLEGIGEFVTVESLFLQLVHPVDFRPAEELHREDAGTGVAPDDARDVDVGVALEVRPNLVQHRRLAVIIHLLPNRAPELVGEGFEREGPGLPQKSHEDGERPADDSQVGLDQLFDTRTAYLYCDALTVDSCVVHLSEARAADRVRVELGEILLNGTDLVFENLLCALPRGRRDFVLQFRQFVHVLRWENVGTTSTVVARV